MLRKNSSQCAKVDADLRWMSTEQDTLLLQFADAIKQHNSRHKESLVEYQAKASGITGQNNAVMQLLSANSNVCIYLQRDLTSVLSAFTNPVAPYTKVVFPPAAMSIFCRCSSTKLPVIMMASLAEA